MVENDDLDPTFANYKRYEPILFPILLEDVDLDSTYKWEACRRYYPPIFP